MPAAPDSVATKVKQAVLRLIGYPYQGTHKPGATTAPSWQSDNAVDIALPVGTPIYAPAAGTISSANLQQGQYTAGWAVTYDTGGDSYFLGHLSRVLVKAGQKVKAGQLIGYSGMANGVAHLHLAERNQAPTNLGGKGAGGTAWYKLGIPAAFMNGQNPAQAILRKQIGTGYSDLPGYGTVVGAKNTVSSVVGGVTGGLSGIEDFIGWISNPANLLRVGEVLAGSAMVLIGLLMLFRITTQTETVQGVTKSVAMAKETVT